VALAKAEANAAEKKKAAVVESAKTEPAERSATALQPPAAMPDKEKPREFAMAPKPVVAKAAPASRPQAPLAAKTPARVSDVMRQPLSATRTTPGARSAPKPAATARPNASPPKPAAVPPPADDGLFSIRNVGGALGVVLLVGAGVVFMRRRSAAEVVDASAFESPLGDDNPFASLDPEVEAETEEIAISKSAQVEVGIPIPEPSTRTAQEGSDMDMVSENATTILDAPAVGATMGGGDTSNMVAEFERRMAAMETRIDEFADAKERLERQVAAQTEELRVQRAAIARTQRAVRNLGRPGEEAPTEPALRDPSRPEGPRT
jgi:hypothetical protein